MKFLGLELVSVRPNHLSAFNLCIEQAVTIDPVTSSPTKLENRQIYTEAGIDAGQWTRIKDGGAHLAFNLYNPVMQICGNYGPLEWLAWSNGLELHKRKSRLELELEAANKRAEEAEQKNAYLLEVINAECQ